MGVRGFAFYLEFPSVAQLVERVNTCSFFSRKGCDRMGYLVCTLVVTGSNPVTGSKQSFRFSVAANGAKSQVAHQTA